VRFGGRDADMTSLRTSLVRGAIAGAAGTTALNTATYLDMVVRARPASSTPEQTVERGADLLGVQIPGDEDSRQARTSGLGPLLGTAAGVAAGLVLGIVRGAGWVRRPATTLGVASVLAMIAGNGPMTVLGVTDPRTWGMSAWLADIVPHVSYAVAATATLEAFE
jgi:hypothetical protein